MTPQSLYGILGCRWQKVLHISIFPLWHLRRLVLLSPRIMPLYFLDSPMANQQEQTLEIAGRAQEGWQQEFSQVVHLTSGLWTLRIVP